MRNPLFVIGISRSGTSLLSTFLGQHPEIEGIYHRPPKVSLRLDGTTHGYSETRHLWRDVLTFPPENIWGETWLLPENIHAVYQNKFVDDQLIAKMHKELKQRINDESKIPLIKYPLFSYKIGVLHKAYPHAKYIYIIRHMDNWINGIKNRLNKSDLQGDFINYYRDKLDLCWRLSNTIILSDLNYYSKDRYYIIYFENMLQNPQTVINNTFEFLGLDNYNIDYSIINNNYCNNIINTPANIGDL